MRTPSLPSLTVVIVALGGLAQGLRAAEPGWTLRPGPDGVTVVAPSGRDLFGYLKTKPAGSALSANSACGIYPLLTPSGESVAALAPKDHPHHRGVFFAWYEVDGFAKADFWGWGAHAPTEDRRIVNTSLRLEGASGADGRLVVENEWRVADRVMLREALTVTSRTLPEGNWHELTFILAPVDEITVPRAAFSGFCVKGRAGADPQVSSPDGPVKLPAPKHDDPTTGWPDAAWYDYTARLDTGKTAGVAVFSHPSNPPTRWHNPVGIAMLNPCILMDGDLKLRPARPLTLRYAVFAHDGPAPAVALDRLAKEYRAKSAK